MFLLMPLSFSISSVSLISVWFPSPTLPTTTMLDSVFLLDRTPLSFPFHLPSPYLPDVHLFSSLPHHSLNAFSPFICLTGSPLSNFFFSSPPPKTYFLPFIHPLCDSPPFHPPSLPSPVYLTPPLPQHRLHPFNLKASYG